MSPALPGPVAVPGQSPVFSGAVTAGGLVFTSGLIAPSVLAEPRRAPEFDVQVREVLAYLGELLDRCHSDLDHVVRVEAFVLDAAYLPGWNAAFARTWRTRRPARTTTLARPGLDGALIEIQATAQVADRGP